MLITFVYIFTCLPYYGPTSLPLLQVEFFIDKQVYLNIMSRDKIRRATARLMIDFGTPVTKIDSPRGESIVPQFVHFD
jgi:hypothetical protein